MPSAHDDLQLLGLKPPVSEATVGRAYRRLVIRHHPDVGGDGQAMAHINEARDRLLASLEGLTDPPSETIQRRTTAAVGERTDNPSPLVYLVWMVLLPTVFLTFLFIVLSNVT